RMSTRATSKEPSRSAFRACAPSDTVSTTSPCCVHARSSTQRIDSSSSATRTRPAGLSLGVDIVLAEGKAHAEARAPAAPILVPDRAAMLAHDALADREPQTAAPRLGGEERREQPDLVLGADPGTRVLDQHGEQLPAADRAP